MDTIATIAPRHVASGAGQALRVISDVVTFKARAAETGGAYTLCETRTLPGGGTPPHYQRHEEESFYVLEGMYAFQVGDDVVRMGPGGYAFAPRGTVHAYTNVGDTPARMLILITPGGIHERFFAEVGTPADAPAPSGRPDMDKLLAAAEMYGIEILPPTDR